MGSTKELLYIFCFLGVVTLVHGACEDISKLTFPQRVYYSQVVLHVEVLNHFSDNYNSGEDVFAAQLKVLCILKSGPLAIGPVINITGAGDMGLCHTNEYTVGRRYISFLYLNNNRLEPNDQEAPATAALLEQAASVCGIEGRKPDWPDDVDPLLRREIEQVPCPQKPDWIQCTDGRINAPLHGFGRGGSPGRGPVVDDTEIARGRGIPSGRGEHQKSPPTPRYYPTDGMVYESDGMYNGRGSTNQRRDPLQNSPDRIPGRPSLSAPNFGSQPPDRGMASKGPGRGPADTERRPSDVGRSPSDLGRGPTTIDDFLNPGHHDGDVRNKATPTYKYNPHSPTPPPPRFPDKHFTSPPKTPVISDYPMNELPNDYVQGDQYRPKQKYPRSDNNNYYSGGGYSRNFNAASKTGCELFAIILITVLSWILL